LLLLAFAMLATGCHYVHFGRPERFRTDAKLAAENADLRIEKKLLQQELTIARKEGEALRAAVDRPREGAEELVTQLNETTRELAALRASYARLKSERERVQATPSAAESGASPDAARLAELQTRLGETEDKLADTLRTFTNLQEENTRLRSSIDEVRAQNAQLTTKLDHVTAANTEARSALAELNTELLAQKTARAEAEQQTEALRAQLIAMANASVATETPSLATARESSATGAREMEAPLRSPLLGSDSSAGAILSINPERLRAAAGSPPPAAPRESVAPALPVAAPEPPPAPTPAPAAKPIQTYVVQAGDTLEKISRKVYGRPDRWNLLYTANTALLNERPLSPGMELTIPVE
jgi:nucleoid-associated protein YgaU